VITRPGRQNNISTPVDPTLVLFNDEAWFHFSAFVNSQVTCIGLEKICVNPCSAVTW
jgi:hypothetical protein